MYRNLYDISGKMKRPVTSSLSLDNKYLDDSDKCINVICITMYYTAEGGRIYGTELSESRSGNN